MAAVTGDSGAAAGVRRGCAAAALLGASPVPKGYGSEALPDGLSAGTRWPRGAALLRGVLWPPGRASSKVANASLAGAEGGEPSPTAVERAPVGVLRGSVAWSVAGGDGPHFFVALSDMPQLGVSMTVWGEVVAEDMARLDALADDVQAGARTLPMGLAVRNLE